MAKKAERSTDAMLRDIRAVLAKYANTIPEKAMYEELLAESDGWKMRLEELEEESL